MQKKNYLVKDLEGNEHKCFAQQIDKEGTSVFVKEGFTGKDGLGLIIVRGEDYFDRVKEL